VNLDIEQEQKKFDKKMVGWVKKKHEAETWPKWLTPNFITLSRFAPVVIALYLILLGKKYFDTAVILIAISGLLDLLDGIVARGTNNITELGKFLDQFIDKLTILVSLWFFLIMSFYVERASWNHPTFIAMIFLFAVIAPVITLFDLLLLTRRLAVKMGLNFGSKEIQANNYGKYKTTLQFWGLCIFIYGYGKDLNSFLVFGLILLASSIAFSYLSFIKQFNGKI